jgi:predicted nuclease with TOPRIM domain
MMSEHNGLYVQNADYEVLAARIKELESNQIDLNDMIERRDEAIARLAAKIAELEELFKTEHGVRIAATNEIKRLREAAWVAMRKCQQYWNEHDIPDAEIHAALETIHSAMTGALKETP